MQVDKYIRLAFVLNDNHAKTLSRNLEKMISLVLYEAQTEVNSSESNGRFEGLEVFDIIDKLKNSYGLDFSENEVFNVVNKERKKPIFICIGINPKKFALVPNEIEKLRNRIRDDSLEKVISDFVIYENNGKFGEEEQSLTEIVFPGATNSEEDIKDILYRYFYTLFNSNASYIRSFLGKKYDTVKLSNSEFNPSEKILINDFVYWKNPAKDKLVYEMVSCCFDYCMLTVKKDTTTYQQVFNNKVFYLDTNIIYRLIGINHENRKKVTDAFIKKCQSVGIKLEVTNFTREEIDGTIDRNVNRIKSVLNGSEPISTNSISYYASSILNPDFYEVYREWCGSNDYNDYPAFMRELKRKALSTMRQYGISYVDYESFKARPDYSDTVDSLISYKQSANRNYNKYAAEVDVNNYLFVKKQNSDRPSSDFFSTHHYLISADHAFGDWAREKVPNGIPIVVLPSVWYSIILQYAGRNTDNDYAAFTRFLNFSLENGERQVEGLEKKKLDILDKVLSLNEPSAIKDSILFDIEERLKDKKEDADYSDDVDAIVEEGLESVTAKAEANARAEEQEKARILREKDSAAYNQDIAKYRCDVESLKEENIRLQEKAEVDKKAAIEEERKRYIENETAALTDTRYKKYITIFIVIIVFEVMVPVFFVISVNRTSDITEMELKIATAIYSIILGAIDFCLFKGIFCSFDKEKIRNIARTDVEDEHR